MGHGMFKKNVHRLGRVKREGVDSHENITKSLKRETKY